ncbi:flap endonuclease-1 [Candidatus Micrarchaeota archaeon RBG_16_36_9]|nr:MAG: flap endonuclease-1 [Candidatus Micrarchaeota archaeon RBG_16_36_9]
MGVQISNILPKKEIEIDDLSGKTMAVDAFLWLHQFLSIIRQPDGTPLKDSKGRITSHLSGLFYRSARLIEKNIKLIWVFDGVPPSFKAGTTQERSALKEEAHKKWREFLEKGDLREARKAAQATSHLTNEMIIQSKNLLDYMGIPVVQAPSEGEAQCSYLCEKNLAYSVASQDSDSLLFNSPRLIRNLSITGKRKLPRQGVFVEVKPELIELKDTLNELGITREQLILLGLLVGTDYNPGIEGYGPKKALALVKKEKTLENVLKIIDWNWNVPAKELYEFFLNPPVDKKVDINFKPMQPDKILNLLVNEHEFSQERVEKVIKSLTQARQTSLGSWLK